MEPTQQELGLDESIKQVMQTLPPVIREYVVQEKYTPVAKGLMMKYDLHIDQGTVLEREIMLLLMGIESPEEFNQALIEEAHLNQQMVGNIVRDVNDQIFTPLREEERKTAEKIPPVTPLPVPQKVAELKSQSLAEAIQKAVQSPPVILVDTKPVEREKLLEDHEEPHIEFNSSSQEATKSAAKTSVPPNLPGAMPSITVPAMPPKPVTPVAPVTSYNVDPYREPIDEK